MDKNESKEILLNLGLSRRRAETMANGLSAILAEKEKAIERKIKSKLKKESKIKTIDITEIKNEYEGGDE